MTLLELLLKVQKKFNKIYHLCFLCNIVIDIMNWKGNSEENEENFRTKLPEFYIWIITEGKKLNYNYKWGYGWNCFRNEKSKILDEKIKELKKIEKSKVKK